MSKLHQLSLVLAILLSGFSPYGHAEPWSLGKVEITEYFDPTRPVDPSFPCEGENVPAGATKTYRCTIRVTDCIAESDRTSTLLLPVKLAILRVSVPNTGTSSVNNTVILFTGGGGTTFLGDASPFALDAINKLVNDGFRTIEVEWQDENWAVGSNAGPAVNACKPATLINFVHHHFGIDTGTSQVPGTQALHAMGNSAGSAQIAYAMSHYGLADILTSTILGGGPPYARIDLGCFYDAGSPLAYSAENSELIDRIFGVNACALNDPTPPNTTDDYRIIYQLASVVFPGQIYNYPNTKVHFIFGTADDTNADEQGKLYMQRILDDKPQYLAVEYVFGMSHILPDSEEGMNAVYQALRAYMK